MIANTFNVGVADKPASNQPVHDRLATFVRSYRERAGLSQTDVQRITGVKREYLSSIELGRITVIYPEVFNKLHRALGFPGWAGLAAMGYDTDAGETGVSPALLNLIRGLSEDEQRAAEQLVRAILKTGSDLNR